MNPFLVIFSQAWKYRWEITAVIKLLSAMRKTAEELTREYIRKRIQQRLGRQLVIVGAEILLLVTGVVFAYRAPSLGTRLLCSSILWGVLVYNLCELLGSTIPELIQLNKFLKSRTGYAVKHILKVSIVTEMMQGNLLLMLVCLFLGITSRTAIGSYVSFVEPWKELFELLLRH